MTVIIFLQEDKKHFYKKFIQMKSEKVNRSLQKALESMRIAEQEMHRPSEDAVTLCACQSTRNSAMEFLRSFLLSKGDTVTESASLKELLAACATHDAHFRSIDISSFLCKSDGAEECDNKYCLSVEKVSECFQQATAIRALVMAKLKISERDLA